MPQKFNFFNFNFVFLYMSLFWTLSSPLCPIFHISLTNLIFAFYFQILWASFGWLLSTSKCSLILKRTEKKYHYDFEIYFSTAKLVQRLNNEICFLVYLDFCCVHHVNQRNHLKTCPGIFNITLFFCCKLIQRFK